MLTLDNIAVIVGLLFWPVVGVLYLHGRSRGVSDAPRTGLTKEEEARDAIAGEMWHLGE